MILYLSSCHKFRAALSASMERLAAVIKPGESCFPERSETKIINTVITDMFATYAQEEEGEEEKKKNMKCIVKGKEEEEEMKVTPPPATQHN